MVTVTATCFLSEAAERRPCWTWTRARCAYCTGSVVNAGAVAVLSATVNGLASASNQLVASARQAGARFGAVLRT